jgi:hypothetical protein
MGPVRMDAFHSQAEVYEIDPGVEIMQYQGAEVLELDIDGDVIDRSDAPSSAYDSLDECSARARFSSNDISHLSLAFRQLQEHQSERVAQV